MVKIVFHVDPETDDLDVSIRELLEAKLRQEKVDTKQKKLNGNGDFCDDCGKRVTSKMVEFCQRHGFDGIYCMSCQKKHKPKED